MGTCHLKLLCEGTVQQAGLKTRASLLHLALTPHFLVASAPLPPPSFAPRPQPCRFPLDSPCLSLCCMLINMYLKPQCVPNATRLHQASYVDAAVICLSTF